MTDLQSHRRPRIQRRIQRTESRHGALAVPAKRGQVARGRAGGAAGEQQQGEEGGVRRCGGGAAGECMVQQPRRGEKALRGGILFVRPA